jgi:hypothetical protein
LYLFLNKSYACSQFLIAQAPMRFYIEADQSPKPLLIIFHALGSSIDKVKDSKLRIFNNIVSII